MADRDEDNEEPVLTTRIDGEEVRLLVHIERLEDPEPGPENPPAKLE